MSNYLYLNVLGETQCVDVKNVFVMNVRTVVVAGDRIRDAGETLDYYPDNLPIGFASSAKIKIDSVKAFNILIKEARAARIGFDYIDYKLRSLEV